MKKYTHDIGRMKKNRLMHFQIGLIIALSAALYVVNISTDLYEKKDNDNVDITFEEITVTPRTEREKKVAPPPVIEIDPENLIIDDTEFEEEPEPVVEPDLNVMPSPALKPRLPRSGLPANLTQKPVEPDLPVVAPTTEKNNLPEITLKIAEIMPRFKLGKNKDASEDEIKKIADTELIRFISKNVRYPAIARENGIQGTVVIRFVVEKDGTVSNIEVLRDLGFGLGDEAKKVIQKMPKWERVGRQNGRDVKVYFTMPIKFQLNN
ncbi:MAG: protein TonB [Maribacter sp.]|jgi:protein TonB